MNQSPTEAQEQAALVEWCDLMRIPVVHIPNEGKRTLANGRELARMGLRRGFPDLFIAAARNGFHGLFIELKRIKGGRVTEPQQKWIDFLNKHGYHAVICYGADEAIKEIRSYYGMSR